MISNCYSHFSQLVALKKQGIRTLMHAMSDMNFFWKIARNPINYLLCRPSFPKCCDNMSHKLSRSYHFLKILLRISNGPPSTHKSRRGPFSIFQHVGRVATRKLLPRKCLRFLKTSTILYGEGDRSQNICEVLSKNMNKKEAGTLENLLL